MHVREIRDEDFGAGIIVDNVQVKSVFLDRLTRNVVFTIAVAPALFATGSVRAQRHDVETPTRFRGSWQQRYQTFLFSSFANSKGMPKGAMLKQNLGYPSMLERCQYGPN